NRDVTRPALLRPAVAVLWASRLFSGSCVVMSAKSWVDMPRRPGDVGLYFLIAILDSLEELDVVAGLERDDRLLPRRTAAGEPAHPLLLASDHQGPDRRHGDLEQVLHRAADLDLVGVARDLEHDLLGVGVALGVAIGRAAGLAQPRRLLGEQRALDDGLRVAHGYSAPAVAPALAPVSVSAAVIDATAAWVTTSVW